MLIGGCSDDHHSHASSSTLALAACTHAGHHGLAVDAAGDATSTGFQPIGPDDGPVTIRLNAAGDSYIWLETDVMHVDAALFVSPAGAIRSVTPVGDSQPLSLNRQDPPTDCAADIAEDIRVHLHMPMSYLVALDGAVGSQAWLLFLNEASDHSTHDHE